MLPLTSHTMIPLGCKTKFRRRNILQNSSIAPLPLMQGMMLLFLAQALAQALTLALALILVQTLARAPTSTQALALLLVLTLTLALAPILVRVALLNEAALAPKRAVNLLTRHRACL